MIELKTLAANCGAEITDYVNYVFAEDVVLFTTPESLQKFADEVSKSRPELATINDNILARVREIFMLREYMVVNNLTAAMSDALREPAQQLYLHDAKFRSLVDGLTAGFMRLFTEFTFPVPPDKVTVFAPAKYALMVQSAMATGSDLSMVQMEDRNGGVLMGFE